jgi:formylglycine-generating enzyme required for sulfatase activity
MNINQPNQPRKDDAVLGGKNPPPINAAVLGGIQGVKARLNPANPIEVKMAALKDALNYGDEGLDIVIQTLQQNPLIGMKVAAYQLLKEREETKIKQILSNSHDIFDFDVITVNNEGLEITRKKHSAYGFKEDIGNGVLLEMVYIPAGTFLMGSSDDEFWRDKEERPQHRVTVKGFFMGKYPVTQTQWKAVVSLPPVNYQLDSDPSYNKGQNHPVEKVSWYEAVEWCDRVSQHTGKQYRLPSEAEWEYACRAGTTTPFHFGETITPEIANDHHDYITFYGEEPEGMSLGRETTPVGSFGVANAFGLYDMHGNVWEWCADRWHDNYEGAPNDGSIWLSSDKYQGRVLRGCSWKGRRWNCRSAFRMSQEPDTHHIFYGFRVVCVAE